MTMRMTWRSAAVTTAATLALTAGSVSAQYSSAVDAGPRSDAVELEQQARELARGNADWGRAAILYRRAAELRTDDPAAARDFRMAGLLSFYAGREGDAARDLARAGEVALEWGDVAEAAHSFLDAAWVADRDGHGSRALELAHRAERLAQSPLLLREERAELLSRIADGPVPPAAPAF
jgi:hypothetical protein